MNSPTQDLKFAGVPFLPAPPELDTTEKILLFQQRLASFAMVLREKEIQRRTRFIPPNWVIR